MWVPTLEPFSGSAIVTLDYKKNCEWQEISPACIILHVWYKNSVFVGTCKSLINHYFASCTSAYYANSFYKISSSPIREQKYVFLQGTLVNGHTDNHGDLYIHHTWGLPIINVW